MKHRSHDFRRLWVGQTISQFGSQIGSAGLALTAILVLQASPLQLGLLAAAAALPALLIVLPAGAWIDRLQRRPILIAADLGRALILLSIPIAYFWNALLIEQLYLVAFLKGILNVFFDLAYHAALPALVSRERLVDANSKLGMSESLAEIAGPGVGGVLVQLLSAPLTMLFDALSFLASALSIWRIQAPEPIPEPPSEQHFWRTIAEGLQFTIRNPILRPLLGVAITTNLFGGIIGTLYMVYGIQELGLTPVVVGVIVGLGGVGALLGALLAEPIARRYGLGMTLLGAALWASLLQLGIPFAGGFWAIPLLVIGQLFGDIGWAIYTINETSLRQAITPDQLLGRANASHTFLVAGAAPLGAILGGILGEQIGLRAALAVGVIGIIMACLWLATSQLRMLKHP